MNSFIKCYLLTWQITFCFINDLLLVFSQAFINMQLRNTLPFFSEVDATREVVLFHSTNDKYS